jgi:putative ABC transport system permease protein
MLRYLPLILKNCRRNRRRTVLTIASIGISMCLLGVMIALFHAFYASAPPPEEALRLVARNKISLTQVVPQFYAERMKHVPGVREVMYNQWFNGVYKDARDPNNFFARMAIEPEKLFTMYPEYKIPEDEKKAFLRDRAGCVIGRDLANKFHFKLGDRIPVVGDIFPGNYEFTVRGIFDSPRISELLYFNRDYLEQTLPEGRRGQVSSIYILIDDPAHSARVAQAIDDEFRNSTTQTKTDSEQAFILSFVSLLGNVKMMLIWISAAVMFTILLVSANTMAMSVRERVREVGVLKTLGFTSSAVLGLILGEASLISFAGGSIGFLLSVVLISGITKSPFASFLPPFSAFDPVVAVVCIATAIGIGVLSSFVPAWGAAGTSIVNALRSTD